MFGLTLRLQDAFWKAHSKHTSWIADLVGVARRLVVVRVGDEARHHAQQRERLDLQVCCLE